MKQTVQEAAREMCEAWGMEDNHGYGVKETFEVGFCQGAQWATNHPWISIEDEFPKEKERVLAHFYYYYKYADREAESRSHADIFTYENGVWTNDDDDSFKGKEVSRTDIRITHWMPIPELNL